MESQDQSHDTQASLNDFLSEWKQDLLHSTASIVESRSAGKHLIWRRYLAISTGLLAKCTNLLLPMTCMSSLHVTS